jgi:hypothetical protein
MQGVIDIGDISSGAALFLMLVGFIGAWIEMRFKVRANARQIEQILADRRACVERHNATMEEIRESLHALALTTSEKLGEMKATISGLTHEVASLTATVRNGKGT